VREGKFTKSLAETIDTRLKHIFGETATSVIYNYLQTSYSLPQEKIPERLDTFADGLNEFLSSGAKVVEKVILEDLYCNYGQKFQVKEGYRFTDYIAELRTKIEEDESPQ